MICPGEGSRHTREACIFGAAGWNILYVSVRSSWSTMLILMSLQRKPVIQVEHALTSKARFSTQMPLRLAPMALCPNMKILLGGT